MNLRGLLPITKKLDPVNTTEPTITPPKKDEFEVWSVRWRCHQGLYSGNIRENCEFFRNSDEAKAFSEQIQSAAAFLRYTFPDFDVKVKREK